ncbi:P-loop containing nucleoside triphosphate hydrolase protein [Serendipita vermifera]|nr:P-loop containing nucleoside triphosphate hydrolase protein [Serendipita vermifera]
MAHNPGSESEIAGRGIHIMLIGDPVVGKASVTRQYIDGTPPPPPGRTECFRMCSRVLFLPPNSSPILPNGQRKRRARKRVPTISWRSHLPEMVLMEPVFREAPAFYTYRQDHDYWSEQFATPRVIAICYDCSRPETLHHAIYKWHPLVQHYSSEVPIFLLGCKSDLKEKLKQTRMPYVTTGEAMKAARQIGAIDALECTAMGGVSVWEIGNTLIWYGYYSRLAKYNGTSTIWSRLKTQLRPAGDRI